MSTSKTIETFWANIYIAGDLVQAKQICREFCQEIGLCVTVTETTFIYTGGEELGICIGLLNYPKFPSTPETITDEAMKLAERLRWRLYQHSYLIQTPVLCYWDTLRD